jgi:Kazal-type serine protease inhibitor domain
MMRAAWGVGAGATIVFAIGCKTEDADLAIVDSGVSETGTAGRGSKPCQTNAECGDSGWFCSMMLTSSFTGILSMGACESVPEPGQCQDAGFNPVCGSDGTWYFNMCLARRARAILSDAIPCLSVGCPSRPCLGGATCERLLVVQPILPNFPNYCSNALGSCWVVPEAGTLQLSHPFVACGTTEPCVDPFTAIADGGLFEVDLDHCQGK